MKRPVILLIALAILAPACSSTPDEGPSPSPTNGRATAAAPDPGEPVSDVTGRKLRVEWRNLNPKNGQQHIGLINRSSPELAQLYRNPAEYAGIKPVDDHEMANVLSAFRASGFYDLAEAGRDVRSYSMGDGHGVVSIVNGDERHALFFPRMGRAAASNSDVPVTYRDLKVLILTIHSSTLWLAPSAPQDPNRTFRAPTPDRRR